MHEVPIDLANASIMAPSVDDGGAGWTTPGRIPEAAVEAAAKAAYNATHKMQWVQLSQGYKRELMEPARLALEAAAAHMLAGAWAEGREAGYSGWDNYKDIADVENPYRAAE